MFQLECIGALCRYKFRYMKMNYEACGCGTFNEIMQVSKVMREVKAHRCFLSKGQVSRFKARKSAWRRQKQLISNSKNLMRGGSI